MRAFHFVVGSFADVMKETGAARLFHVQAELTRHQSGKRSNFDRMLQLIVRTGKTEAQTTEQTDQLLMQAVQTQVERGLLAGLLGNLFDFFFAFFDQLFDARGMDAAIANQTFERHLGDFATHRIEAADHHCLWRVVDDEVDAARVLERANIAAFATDDAALHVV